MLSLIVPVYNVEPYVAQSLDSVLSQTLDGLEIIVVNDCSTDNGMEIVRSYAARDSRIKIVELPENRGLSAARNAGIRVARGKYLGFLDSDDVLLPNALSTAIRCLEKSGSDFSVHGLERFNSTRSWASATWVSHIHTTTKIGVRAQDHPDVLANAVIWTKVFRRSFWDQTGLTFPEGRLYEDQAVSARAYASAKAIDIIGEVLVRWRAREDNSSITQQQGTTASLVERADSLFTAVDVLSEVAGPELAASRLSQILSNDFSYSVPRAIHADSQYWDMQVEVMRRLFGHELFSEKMWDAIAPSTRIAYELVLRNDRAGLTTFVDQGGKNIKNFPTDIVNGKALVQLPFYADHEMNIDPSRFELLPRQMSLITATRRVWWDDDETLCIDGWAYIDNIDTVRYPITTTAVLVGVTDGARIDCELTPRTDPDVSAASKHLWANYEGSAFHLRIGVKALLDSTWNATWRLELHSRAGGLEASGLLKGRFLHGSAGNLAPRFHDAGIRVLPKFSSAKNFCVTVSRASVQLVRASTDANRVTVEIQAATSGWKKLQIARKDAAIEVPLTPRGNGLLGATFTLPARVEESASAGADASQRPSQDTLRSWAVRAVNASGRMAAIAWRPSAEVSGPSSPSAPRLLRTRAGNLGVDDATAVVQIVDAEVRSDALVIELRLPGAGLDSVSVELAGSKARTETVVALKHGDNSVTIPLKASLWGGPLLPLPVGLYRLNIHAAGQRVKASMEEAFTARTPVEAGNDQLRLRMEVWRDGRLAVRVIRPLAPNERGARQQRELQQWHADLPSKIQPGAALFRTYYGENAADNAAAIHAELRRQNSAVKLYWAVTDHSVPVPEGGIPVIHNSTEWYRLLRQAEFYVENMHQPIYHVKSAGQKVISAFHGYPFKLMGLPHWQRMKFSQARIDSYFRRAADWDYLVSPATYATPYLCRDFGYDGEVLEIGYPRNDILQSPDRDALRRDVRKRLGIGDEQTAILYAPTFRDYLSPNDWSAPAVDLIDLPELANELGPDFVILVRGHAFNARAGSKFSGEGIIDVTHHPDVAHLYLAVDAAVVDYSSLRFDFAITRKPMVFLVPDRDKYVGTRGWLFDFEPTAPGPLVNDLPQTVAALQDLDAVRLEYADAYQAFLDTYVDLDDGHASERFVAAVFK